MTDIVRIRGLRVHSRIGVSDQERVEPRPVVVDVDIYTDTKLAGESDRIEDTVDYSHIVNSLVALAESGEIHLLEHLASRMADFVLDSPRVERVAVEVMKEDPPVEADVETVSVRIERP